MAAHPYHSVGIANGSSTNNAFQMPSYTSHTSRSGGASSPSRLSKQHAPSKPFSSDYGASRVAPDEPLRTDSGRASQYDSDASMLEMLSSTVACLEQKHMDLEALGCLEQSLWLKRRMFGVDASVVQRALTNVVLRYNAVAMQYLAQTQFDQCLAMLRKAEAITAPGNFRKCQALQILTFNNIGCCYRKLGKLKSALKYLQEAAQLGAACAHVKNLSITHLNLCAIQSQLGRHDLALEHAQAAIFHTQEELVSIEAAVANGSNSARRDDDEDADDSSSSLDVLDAKSREEKVISLAVAYHNLAVELEFNGRSDASLQWYKKALQLVWTYRATNAALCASFKQIFLDAKHKLARQRIGTGGTSGTGSTTNRATTPAVSRVSSNAFSGSSSDRRKPMTRPQSAHYHRRGNSGSASTTAAAATRHGHGADLSYSANVASQCYKPVRPSTAALQYASTESARRGSIGGSGSVSGSHTAQRTASATASARPRPMSASAAARASHKQRDASSTESLGLSIDAHWRRLEKEFAIESASVIGAAGATTRTAQFQSQHQTDMQTKRPQSACAAASANRAEASRRNVNQRERDAFAAQHNIVISDLDDDDDDCGVLDDDEPSDDDANDDSCSDGGGHGDDAIADLLLRRSDDGDGDSSRTRSSRGARHRLALDEARRKLVSSAKTQHLRSSSNSAIDRGASAADDDAEDDADALRSGSSSSSDDSELPHQRVSHLAYLRRMKRLAETIKDDLTGAAAPSVRSRSSSALDSRAAAARSSTWSPTRTAVSPSRAPTSSSRSTAAAAATTSKVRERLERMRSDSCEQLDRTDQSQLNDNTSPSYSETEASTSQPVGIRVSDADVVVEVVVNEASIMCTSDLELMAAEELLVQHAAAKRIQTFVRGEQARTKVHRRQQQLRDDAAAREAQAHAIAFAQQDAIEREQHEAEHVAATAIQQAFRARAGLTDLVPPCSADTVESSSDVERTSAPTEPLRSTSPLETHRRESAAAVRIQATVKGRLARTSVRKHCAAQLSRTYVERKHMEVALHHAAAQELSFLEALAATAIQALVRGRQSRMLTDATCIGRHAAAERIQTHYRAHAHRALQVANVGVHSVAVRTIQRVVRTYQQRQHAAAVVDERCDVQHIAATSLQRFWRTTVAARSRDVAIEALEAATCIQALGRGHLARRSVRSLRASTSQLDGLSNASSAFSISDAIPHDASDDDSLSPRLRPRVDNTGFLPPAVRALFAAFIVSPSDVATREQQRKHLGAAVQAESLSFDDLLLEFETCSDADTACAALDALAADVTAHAEQLVTLATAVRIAHVLDMRIRDRGVWTPDVERAALELLSAFHDVLVSGD